MKLVYFLSTDFHIFNRGTCKDANITFKGLFTPDESEKVKTINDGHHFHFRFHSV